MIEKMSRCRLMQDLELVYYTILYMSLYFLSYFRLYKISTRPGEDLMIENELMDQNLHIKKCYQ